MAAISIQALTNQGLFKQAQNARNLTEEKTAEENAILTNYLEQMNAIIGGQVTESIPDGATVTPINDITTWLKTGGISKQYSYTTIEQVIADSTCTESLMKNENAMKYLARSTEFADAICASETAMTNLGQSKYVDNTVLNSDLWKQKIKASQYWSLVYTTVYTIHAGALETITIDGVYGSFTTNSDGTVNHVLPLGELTLHGSVSEQSFTRTVTKDTTDIYVMPVGALYWYGNECGQNYYARAYTSGTLDPNYSTTTPSLAKNTNSMIISNTRGSSNVGSVFGSEKIDFSKFDKIKIDGSCSHTTYSVLTIVSTNEVKNNYVSENTNNFLIYSRYDNTPFILNSNLKNATHYDYLAIEMYMGVTLTINALWLE